MTDTRGLPSKIAIAGPGRSGTSLLVKILNAAGLNTPGSDTEYEEINAGRESRIGIGSPFEVDKDPWLYAYAESLSDESWSEYRALVIPIRNLTDASLSRSKNERVSRLVDDPDLDHWKWDTWGRVPGGALSATSAADIGAVLSAGLWTLIEVATTKKIPIVLLNFPAFANDVDYLWTQLGPHLPERVTHDVFVDAWKATVRPELARDYATGTGGPDVVELNAMVEELASRIAILKREHSESAMALGERTWQVGELERILAETRVELARANNTVALAEVNNARGVEAISELISQSDGRIAAMNQRIDHLVALVERTSQPFPLRLARYIRNRFAPRA